MLFASPFRPFFLMCALYAVVVMTGWLGLLFIGWPVGAGFSPLRWHAHEMIFGVTSAAIAGFVLTAMATWTDRPAIRGAHLAALLGLWLAARLAMWSGSLLSPLLIAALDTGFLAVLTVTVASTLLAAGSRRNYPVVAVLAALTCAAGASHVGMWQASAVMARTGEQAGLYLVLLLIGLIGGRITPAFSANWLARRGLDRNLVRSWPVLDIAALSAIGITAALDLAGVGMASGAALAAAALNGLRLVAWSGWRCWREPLLWSLHLGYAWLVAALLLRGLAPFSSQLNEAAWLHAAGVGAMGTMLLAVMTRVPLGHTGRALRLSDGAVLIYGLITAAAALRVGSAVGWVDYRWALAAAGTAWMFAFVLYLAFYAWILLVPRSDGHPG